MKNADIKKRFIAALMDALLVVIVYMATNATLNETGFRYARLLAIINCYIMIIAFPVFIWTGQTIGKKLLKIRAISLVKEPNYKALLFVRELCKCVLFTGVNVITIALFVGFPLVNPKGQAIHDLITKTKVIDLAEYELQTKTNQV